MNYEQLLQAMKDAASLRASGKSIDYVNRYLQQQYDLHDTHALVEAVRAAREQQALAAPGPEDQGSMMNPRAAAVHAFGKGAALGWGDRMGALLDAINALEGGMVGPEDLKTRFQRGVSQAIPAYQQGLQEQQQYGEEASAAFPTTTKVAGAMGTAAPFLATGGAGAPLQATGLPSAIANPGIVGLLSGAAAAGAVKPGTSTGEAVKDIGMGTGEGILAGAIGTFIPRVISRWTRPAALYAEKLLSRSGGPAAVNAAGRALEAAAPGIKPTLVEAANAAVSQSAERAGGSAVRGVESTVSRVATRLGVRINPEAAAIARSQAETALREAEMQTARISAKYNQILQRPLDTPGVRAVVQRPEVQRMLSELQAEGIRLPNDLTARTLNDVRQMLQQEAEPLWTKVRMKRAGPAAIRRAKALTQAAEDLERELNQVPGFQQLQQEYGPYARVVAERRQLVAQLARRGRAAQLPLPKGLHGEILESFGLEKGDIDYRRVRDILPHLFGPYDDALHAIHAMQPRDLGSLLGAAAATYKTGQEE